jgi:tryptophanyl-tRNA synthetase
MSETAASTKPRLLTGDRPTGPLHLGHLVGSLQTRVALQDSHDSMLIVADLHTLTTRPARGHIDALPGHVRAVVLDLLAVGIDPEQTTIYLQSGVPAVYDLAILLQMLTPMSRLERVESVKDMARAAGLAQDEVSLGLLGYPVLQAADILMARAEVIPVGGDNLAHVDIARELATRFNEDYDEVFPIPEARSSRIPLLPGVGAAGAGDTSSGGLTKMSKSRGNTIALGDDPAVVAEKISTLEDEPLRAFLDAFVEDRAEAAELVGQHDAGTLSDGAAHERLVKEIEALLAPTRERRARFSGEQGLIEEILVDGTLRAREIAYETLQKARAAMGLESLWRGLVETTEARAHARKRPY